MNVEPQTPIRKDNKGRTQMVWVASTLGLVMLAGALYFFISKLKIASAPASSTTLTLATPLHTLTFEDGSSLNVFNIGDGGIIDGDMNPKAESTLFYSENNTSSETSSMSGCGVEVRIKIVELNDHITGIEFTSEPGNLILETQLLGIDKKPIDNETLLWDRNIRKTDHETADFPGWGEYINAAKDDATMPEIAVQLSDGDGGWINGCGPVTVSKDPKKRAMVAFAAWPRSQAELEFRAARSGMKPVIWKMKNPAYLGRPAAWVASPLPQKHTDVDFELELESISQTKGKRLIDPDFSFVSKLQASVTKENEPESQKGALECKCTELSGSWGTRSLWNYSLSGNHPHSGYPYPPEEKILRFRFEITAKKKYPYPRTQALLFAKAKIAADGISLEAPPQILTSYGVLSVDIDDIKTGEKGCFRCKIKAKWDDKSQRLAGEAMLGKDNRLPVCFIGDASVSLGEAHDNGYSYSSSGDVMEITRTDEWIGPLSPGDEVYIGTVTPLPTREVFFTFEP